jgi:hypothetical protein
MSYCWKCGTKLENNAAYCPKCGTPVATQETYRHGRIEERPFPFPTVILAIAGTVIAIAIIIITLLAIGLLPGVQTPFGQVGSGHLQTQQFNIADFTAVSASNGFTIQITQGNSYSINVTTDDNLQQYVNVYKSGSTLYVGLKPGIGYQTTQLRAEVTMPDLQNLQASGGTTVTTGNFNVTSDFVADLSGGSRLTMTGQGANINVRGSGGANINLTDFPAHNATVDLSGGSQCIVNLDGRLDATLSGGSQLHYKGNPTLGRIDTSGGASISPAA